MENTKIDIPEEIQQVCRDLAKVAQEHGLQKLSGHFDPPYETGWRGDISFGWEAGRHGEDRNQITISSQFHVYTKVRPVSEKGVK